MDFLARVEPVIGVERLIQMEIDEEGDDVGPPIDILRITRGGPNGSGANLMPLSRAQVMCWDRGRPARNEREARNLWEIGRILSLSRLRLICGRDARGPSQPLESFQTI